MSQEEYWAIEWLPPVQPKGWVHPAPTKPLVPIEPLWVEYTTEDTEQWARRVLNAVRAGGDQTIKWRARKVTQEVMDW